MAALSSFSASSIHAETPQYSVYKIQPGDTVSDVLWRLQIIPVYGKRGMLRKVVGMNSGKVFANGDLVFPDGVLVLPIPSGELSARLEASSRFPAQAAAGATATTAAAVTTIATATAATAATSAAEVPAAAASDVMTEAVPAVPVSAPVPMAASAALAPVPVPPLPAAPAPVVAVATVAVTSTPPMPPPPRPQASVSLAAAPSPVLPTGDFDAFSEVLIGVQGDYSVLAGQDRTTGTSGRLLSKLNSALQVQWKQHWSGSFATFLVADSRSTTFEPETHGVNIYNASARPSHFGVGAESKAGSSAFNLSASFGDELFYRGYLGGGTGIEVNTVSMARFRAGYDQTWLRHKPFSLLSELGLTYLPSSSYDNYQIESGWAYDLGLFIKQDFVNKNFKCGAFYSERRQNTSLILLNERSLGGRCVLGWSL